MLERCWKHVSIIVSSFYHASMPHGNTECFCLVAEANFASWKKIDAGNNDSRVAKLGNIGETCTRTGISGNKYPRFPGL